MFVNPSIFQRKAAYGLAVGLALAMSLGACKKDDPAVTDATAPATAEKPVPPPAEAVAAQVVAMNADQLREAASAALREQRLYAPAGNNAMEYYVALRDKQPNDAAVASALTDLMPYALIATEQSIGRDDFVEAQRLYALMEKADPQAPALPRLKQGIADAQASLAQRTAAAETASEEEAARLATLEEERAAQQEQQQKEAAAQLAQQQQAQAAEAETARLAAEREAAAKAAAEREAAQRAAAATPPASATPAAASANDLRPISTPGPAYPRAAQRAGTSGEVQVEFTVGVGGSVTSARVVRASPPRVFDRAALDAVNSWRFQPVSAPVTTRRSFAFQPGN